MENDNRRTTQLWGSLLVLLLLAQSALAQAPTRPAGGDAGNPVDIRTIYVPFKEISPTVELPGGNVIVPYSTIHAMTEQLRALRAGQSGPGAVLTDASYIIKADDAQAQINATWKFEVLRPETRFSFSLGDIAVGAFVAPEGVLLRGVGQGNYELSFPQTGSQQVKLELAGRVNQSPSGREFILQGPPAAVTLADITVPQAEQTVDIVPTAAVMPVDGAVAADSTRKKVALGATSKMEFRWHAQAGNAPEMDLLTSVNSQTLVTVADGQIHTHVWLTYDILRGELNQVRFAIPDQMRLLEANSETRIRGWQTQKQDGRQIVTVNLLQPATKQLKLELDAETKLGEGPFVIGGMKEQGPVLGIQPLDSLWANGQLALRHSSDLTLNPTMQHGLVRINSSEAAPHLAGSNALLYRFYTSDYSVELTAQPLLPRLSVAHQTQIDIRDDGVVTNDILNYTVERAGIFELLLRLPDNVTVDEVNCPQMKGYNVQGNLLTVSLSERTLGAIPVIVKGRRPLPSAMNEEFPLPILTPEGVERENGGVLIYARESLEVQTPPAGVQAAQPRAIAERTRLDESVLTSAWTYTRRPVVIPVRLQKKPARLSAQVATTIDVQPEITRVKTRLNYRVELSPLNTFRFEIPEALSKLLQIEVDATDNLSAPIRQKTAADPVDGKVVWTIVTQREIVGQQKFLVSFDTKSEVTTGGAEGVAVPFSLPRPLGLVDAEGAVTTPLTSLFGEISVQKDRTLSVTAAPGDDLEQIDNRELTLLPQSGTLAYRYYRDDAAHPVALGVTTRRFDIQNVVSTIISRGLVEVVASEDSQATYRCRYQLQTSERQRLLLALPEHLEVLGMFVNDREVKLEKADTQLPEDLKLFSPYWLNINRPESSEVPLMLTFQFLWHIQPALGESQFGSGGLYLPLPVIDVSGNGVVQELKAVVWVPEKYMLVGNPGPFRMQTIPQRFRFIRGDRPDHQTAGLDEWITNGKRTPGGIAQFPTEGRVPYIYTTLGKASQIELRWWHKLGMAIMYSFAAIVIGWILLSTSWENRLGVLLIFAFLAALYGLSDSAGLYAAYTVGKYGLALMLAVWILHAILRRPERAAPPQPTPPPSPPEAAGPLQIEPPTQPAT